MSLHTTASIKDDRIILKALEDNTDIYSVIEEDESGGFYAISIGKNKKEKGPRPVFINHYDADLNVLESKPLDLILIEDSDKKNPEYRLLDVFRPKNEYHLIISKSGKAEISFYAMKLNKELMKFDEPVLLESHDDKQTVDRQRIVISPDSLKLGFIFQGIKKHYENFKASVYDADLSKVWTKERIQFEEVEPFMLYGYGTYKINLCLSNNSNIFLVRHETGKMKYLEPVIHRINKDGYKHAKMIFDQNRRVFKVHCSTNSSGDLNCFGDSLPEKGFHSDITLSYNQYGETDLQPKISKTFDLKELFKFRMVSHNTRASKIKGMHYYDDNSYTMLIQLQEKANTEFNQDILFVNMSSDNEPQWVKIHDKAREIDISSGGAANSFLVNDIVHFFYGGALRMYHGTINKDAEVKMKQLYKTKKKATSLHLSAMKMQKISDSSFLTRGNNLAKYFNIKIDLAEE